MFNSREFMCRVGLVAAADSQAGQQRGTARGLLLESMNWQV